MLKSDKYYGYKIGKLGGIETAWWARSHNFKQCGQDRPNWER